MHHCHENHTARRRLPGALLLGGLCLALLALPRFWEAARMERLERELRLALQAAYGATGAYPQSLSQLETMGMGVDEDRYLIRFVPLGSNRMPDVEILPRGKRP